MSGLRSPVLNGDLNPFTGLKRYSVMSSEEISVLLSTAPKDAVPSLVKTLVEEKLVACINQVNGVLSTYHWEGKVCEDEEVLLIIKTTTRGVERCQARLIELHPYTVPEVLQLPTVGGNPSYLKWVVDSVASPDTPTENHSEEN